MSGTPWTPLLCKQGDTFKRTIAITDVDGAGVATATNITGAGLTFHLREAGGSTDALTIPLAITNPTDGLATLTLTKEQTAALSPATAYEYEVEMTDGAGEVGTPVAGSLAVLPDRG